MKTPPKSRTLAAAQKKSPLVVVAAVIESHGPILACQRRKNDAFGLKWEFPGGKLKPDETPPQALARELREELGVDAQIGPGNLSHAPPLRRTSPRNRANLLPSRSRRIPNPKSSFRTNAVVSRPDELPALDFLPADQEFIAKLANPRLNKLRTL